MGQRFVCGLRVFAVLCGLAAVLQGSLGWAQEAPDTSAGPVSPGAPVERRTPQAEEPQQETSPLHAVMPPMASYDKAIFDRPAASADLQFLKQFDGAPSGDLWSDRQFKHVVRGAIPGVMFHYGRDMSLPDAVDNALSGSRAPVQVRDGRYVLLAGRCGLFPGLQGQGFMWVDMQDGIVLGGFYFHPTNGEPTPSVTVFSNQVREDGISLGELPPAFAEDLSAWQMQWGVPMVTTRYFIGDTHRKILLEHDEDYCAPANGHYGPAESDCEQMDADAADADMTAAYFLDQVHYATNATAWMLGPDQVEFLEVRDRTCGRVVDPLACRVRVTRERTRVILGRVPVRTPRR